MSGTPSIQVPVPSKQGSKLAKGPFAGTFIDPATGLRCPFSGEYKVAINLHGRESMHLSGTITVDGQELGFSMAGIVDHERNFAGREREAAIEWIQGHCDHLVGAHLVPT